MTNDTTPTSFDLPARRRDHRLDAIARQVGITGENSFDVLDCTREEERVILSEHGMLQPYVEETDTWVNMPVRVVFSQNDGCVGIEVGLYWLDTAEVEVLRSALMSYDLAVNGPGEPAKP